MAPGPNHTARCMCKAGVWYLGPAARGGALHQAYQCPGPAGRGIGHVTDDGWSRRQWARHMANVVKTLLQ